ncbi:hypothetical protein DXG01_008536 [Tephrocybe rancida]|nr:hypothetical protein DXG01_008536 [Tephrocybe rancida]
MSEPLVVHDLITNDDEESAIEKLPYFNMRTDFEQFDPPESRMCMEHGGLVRDLPGDIHLNVRLDLIRAFLRASG